LSTSLSKKTPPSFFHSKAFHEGSAPELNKRAVRVLKRVEQKLTGTDFNNKTPLDVPEQVQKLIDQATSHQNLCQSYVGWCPFW